MAEDEQTLQTQPSMLLNLMVLSLSLLLEVPVVTVATEETEETDHR